MDKRRQTQVPNVGIRIETVLGDGATGRIAVPIFARPEAIDRDGDRPCPARLPKQGFRAAVAARRDAKGLVSGSL